MVNFGDSMLWYWIAYIAVTLAGILHMVFNIFVLHMKPMDSNSMGEGYERTKPFHPLYNIVIFTICASFYLNTLPAPAFSDALLTGFIWAAITILFDVFGWVIIKHPWSLSFREFYIDYQPWITLIYLAIAVSPMIAYGIRLI
jgi:hypothetical protein